MLTLCSEVNYFKKIYNEKLLDKKALLKKWRIKELSAETELHDIAAKYKGVIKKKRRNSKKFDKQLSNWFVID